MKTALTLLVAILVSSLGFSQDVKVREEAVRLLERAHSVSTSPNLPNLERIDTFRVFGGEPAVQEGSFTRVVIQGTGRRDEYTYGTYHLLNVWAEKQVAVVGIPALMPPELVNLMRMAPILLVRFDGEDVIHAIVNRDVNGLPARCIEFDTIRGEKTQNNELCVDGANGTLISEKLAPELIEYSDFFPFAGALMPGKISYSQGGVQKMEVAQTMTVLEDASTNVLAAPPNAEMHRLCTTFRRPFGVSMPQPRPGNGGGDVEVIVRGMVGVDGRVYDAVVQRSERPDLNEEALATTRQWSFTPAMCNGKPDAHEVELTVQFQGR